MQSLLRRTTDFFTPSASANASTTSLVKSSPAESAKPETSYIFPTVHPTTDGPDCQLDCSSCAIHYPAKFSIDEDDALYGNVQAWGTHVIVATGKTDWVRDVADEKGSVMEAMGQWHAQREGRELRNGRCMISASNMPVPDYECDRLDHDGDGRGAPYAQPGQTEIIVLPKWEIVENIHPGNTPAFMESYLENIPGISEPLHPPPPHLRRESPTNAQPSNPSQPIISSASSAPEHPPTPPPDPTLDLPGPLPPPSHFRTRPLPHAALILLCSQKTRDARCGQSAPLLRREFERHLRPLGLYRDLHDKRPGGVGVYFVSHVGGHRWSANVLVYRRGDNGGSGDGVDVDVGGGPGGLAVEGEAATKGGMQALGEAAQCIWLARVRPEDCEGIVRFTVLQGKVVKPERQLRGGFDRGRGIASW